MEYADTFTPEKSSSRIVWVDFVRVISTFLVVLAHVEGWSSDPRWANTIYYTLSRNGVPLFFLISGFLLLSRQEDASTFLKKRAWKILIPFFVWSIIYDVYWNQSLAETGLTLRAILSMLIRILRGPRATHLWFFYALIGLYLFTPILRLFVSKAKNTDILYYIGLWFLAVPVLAIVQEFSPLRSGFELQLATGYVGYYLLGLFLGRLELSRKNLLVFVGLFIIGFVSTFLVFQLNLPPHGGAKEIVFRSYLSANIILMAVPVFVFLRVAGQKLPRRFLRILDLLSQASFGIYLVHSIVMMWLSAGWASFGFPFDIGSSLWVIPLVAVLAFVISFAITMVLRKIPFIRSIVP